MAFIAKHLPDGFYQEPDAKRRSLRSVIFHEVIVNMLGHREYTIPYPAKLIIEKDRVRTENWCKPHGYELIDPKNFTPQTKNPAIAKFFREIERFEELGSGVMNIFKYTQSYFNGKQPELFENDLFKMVIPIPELLPINLGGLSGGLNYELNDDQLAIFECIKKNPEIQTKQIVVLLDKAQRTTERHIKPLIEKGYIVKTGGYIVRSI